VSKHYHCTILGKNQHGNLSLFLLLAERIASSHIFNNKQYRPQRDSSFSCSNPRAGQNLYRVSQLHVLSHGSHCHWRLWGSKQKPGLPPSALSLPWQNDMMCWNRAGNHEHKLKPAHWAPAVLQSSTCFLSQGFSDLKGEWQCDTATNCSFIKRR